MERSTAWGHVRIRQVYARAGHSLCAVSIPSVLMEKLGWKPGHLLQYYPTKDGGMKLVLSSNLLAEQFEDFDPSLDPRSAEGEEMKGVRPGSIAERNVRFNDEIEEAIASIGQIEKRQQAREQAERDREAKAKKQKPRRR